MNLWIRLLRLVLTARFRPRLGFFDDSVLSFAVLPTDLDFNLHMNNARYLALMDLGRFDLVLRTGLVGLLWREKLRPVLAAAQIRYRRPLMPFQAFRLRSRLVGWDDRWFYLEQSFERHGTVLCTALVKAAFLKKGGGRPRPRQVLELVGWSAPPPPVPAWVARWKAFDMDKDGAPAGP